MQNSLQQEVYLATDDVTVTVDPGNRDQWIYDGDGFDAHKRSVARGLEFDARAYKQSLKWYESDQGPVSVFQPTSAMIDGMPKYAAPVGVDCTGWRKYKRDPARFGKLPVIEQALYDGVYMNKSIGDIEHEQRESDRRTAGRIFDKSGYTR